MTLLFDLPTYPTVPVVGENARFPVNRVFCVGRNYEAHAREMGGTATRDAPIWFTKSPAALCLSGATIAYPPRTQNCHYEMELVVAIGAPAFRIAIEAAPSAVLGYACGLDMTRRDLQNAARDKGHPWDLGKDFENSAIIAPITRAEGFGEPDEKRITLTQNRIVKQDAVLSDMVWSVPELIADLSTLYHLVPGDLIYTGTPAGVGPIAPGDRLEGNIDGLTSISLDITEAE